MRQSRKSSKTQEPKAADAEPEAPAPIPRRGRADAAGHDALGHASGALGKAGFADMSLVLRWREIAGPELARIAIPSRFQEGPEGATLSLRCEPGAALFLQHQTRPLIERLNSYLGPGRVVRLRFVPGRINVAPELPAHPAGARSGDGAAERPKPESLHDALDRLKLLRQTSGRQRPVY